jgi:hypothetical protein
MQASCKQTRARPPAYPAAMTTYRIKQVGSLKTGWAIERDGVIIRSHPRAEVLGAWLDATLAGANEYDASDIAKAIEQWPAPTYEERLAVFSPTGRGQSHREIHSPSARSPTRGRDLRCWGRPELSLLGVPLPRGLACVTMYAGPNRRRFVFFLDVVAARSDEGPGMAIGHHVRPEVATIGAAKRDRAAVAIDAPRSAGDVAFANQCPQVFGCRSSGGPSHGWPDSGASIPQRR